MTNICEAMSLYHLKQRELLVISYTYTCAHSAGLSLIYIFSLAVYWSDS